LIHTTRMVFTTTNNSSNGLGNGSSIRTQNNVITAQFDALTREQSKFEQTASNADTERIQLEETIKKIRIEQKQLSNQLRDSQVSLGRYDREYSMLVQQKVKHEETIKKERTWLQQCVDEVEQLSSTIYQQKQSFCTDMYRLNEELSNILLQQEYSRLATLITTDTCNVLLDHYNQSNSMKTNEHTSSPDGSIVNESSLRIKEMIVAIEEYKYVEKLFHDWNDTQINLLQSIHQHRLQFIGTCTESDHINNKTMTDILDMERSWVNDETESNSNIQYGTNPFVTSNHNHVQDFYELEKDVDSQNEENTMSID
jgi:hypothetical protein